MAKTIVPIPKHRAEDFSQLPGLLDSLKSQLLFDLETRRQLDKMLKDLENEPLVDGIPRWQGTYLYLDTHSDGKRIQHYVGCKPEKVNFVLNGIARKARHQKLCKEKDLIEKRVQRAMFMLTSVKIFLEELS
jgi:hypothetical protein